MSEDTAEVPTVNIDVAQEREKARLVSLLFFDHCNQTENQKLNLIGIFDSIRVNPEIKRTHPFGVFIRTGQTLDDEVSVKIFDPNSKLIAGFSYGGDESPPDRRPFQAQILMKVQLDTPVEGLYWFDVSYKDQSIGGAGLQVEFRKVEANKDEHTTGNA